MGRGAAGELRLVTGGSGSGKSQYAEKLILESGAREKIYIATMEVWGEEERQKVLRHRRLRAGKGFRTVECPRCLGALSLEGGCPAKDRAVLVECMANLAANELFGAGDLPEMPSAAGGRTGEGDVFAQGKGFAGEAFSFAGNFAVKQAFSRIMAGILSLKSQCGLLVEVTNEVFSDGIHYGLETEEYLRLLSQVNVGLSRLSRQVTEVVYGIPVELKAADE